MGSSVRTTAGEGLPTPAKPTEFNISDNMESTIITQCLDLTKTLRALEMSFNISIKLENSHIRFSSKDDNEEQTKKKKKSPSQQERDSERKKGDLKKKKADKPKTPHKAEKDKVEAVKKVLKQTSAESDVSNFLDNLLKPTIPQQTKGADKKKTSVKKSRSEKCSFIERNETDLKKHDEGKHKEKGLPTTNPEKASSESLAVRPGSREKPNFNAQSSFNWRKAMAVG